MVSCQKLNMHQSCWWCWVDFCFSSGSITRPNLRWHSCFCCILAFPQSFHCFPFDLVIMNWREGGIFVLSMIWNILMRFPQHAKELSSLMTLVLFMESLVLTRASFFSETVFFPVFQGERKIKTVSLVPGQLLCLEHAVQQEYFSQHHASLLHVFVSK